MKKPITFNHLTFLTLLHNARAIITNPGNMLDLSGKMILAPLTRGGNLPFRRLCADFGMEISMGEMIYARNLIKSDRVEKARLRRAPSEQIYGVQMATNQVDEGIRAMVLAQEAGADFVDLNCGCPIYAATRRGLGSSLLRSPPKLAKLVHGIVQGKADHGVDIPLTVKIRLGTELDKINVREVVSSLREAGAAAVTVHGRTAQQRYSKSADWDLIKKVVEDRNESTSDHLKVPIIGNGDILTHYEARRRIEEAGVDSVMVGRGALIKPWIFQEFRDNQVWEPDVQDRIAVYRTLSTYMKEHFGDDDMGRKKSWYFLPWHFEFLCRYIPLPEKEFGPRSIERPLIQTRLRLGSDDLELSTLEILLSHRSPDTHKLIAAALWESTSDLDAVTKLTTLAESQEFQEIRNASLNSENERRTSGDADELANIPDSDKRSKYKRRGRNPKPQRTPEEIAAIRAERAAKKLALQNAENVESLEIS